MLHGDRWSLVVQPGAVHPTSWAFLDGYGAALELSHAVFCFDDDPSPLGMAWTDMIAQVLTLTT
ncbi:hypothetical protein C1I95_25700 [Micromonospora craterilacus]|uniref:Uncharacterized protein n=1 Tax=Micromonospora craterilacus TaxID=1655439 RepID=A0A2W2EJQ3_9ACTN|nr:hypothetical protein C1I95_25700 [Micromonospora craterilacus]